MKIPIEVKAYQDEILSSWLIRNSIANGSDPRSWTSGIWFDFRAWTRDIDRHLPKSRIGSLSKITSLSREQIKDLTLEPLIEKITLDAPLNPNKNWLFVVSTGNRGGSKINGTHFCSQCLTEPKPYLKKQWRLAWNIACPIHNQLLIQKCQQCSKNFAPHLIDYLHTDIHICTNCGYDLRTSTVTKVNPESLLFQESLNKAIFQDIIDPSFPLVEHTANELFYTIRILFSFFRALARLHRTSNLFEKIDFFAKNNLFSSSKNSSFEQMNIEDREILLMLVSRLFKLKQDEIQELFKNSKITYKMLAQQIGIQSKTIDNFAKDLMVNNQFTSVTGVKKEIKPKSKDEVDKLMDDIRKFL